jgi:hypothetical protein
MRREAASCSCGSVSIDQLSCIFWRRQRCHNSFAAPRTLLRVVLPGLLKQRSEIHAACEAWMFGRKLPAPRAGPNVFLVDARDPLSLSPSRISAGEVKVRNALAFDVIRLIQEQLHSLCQLKSLLCEAAQRAVAGKGNLRMARVAAERLDGIEVGIDARDRHVLRLNVKMTGPPTQAAKPPPAVVGPCRLTCCTGRTAPERHDAASATGAAGAAHSVLDRGDAGAPAHRTAAVHPERNWWTRPGATARPACRARHRWSAYG